MIRDDCLRAEVLAGAVALGEASDAERDAYRRHLTGCRACIASLGGEREIERTMQGVVAAREAETWEPDMRGALRRRLRGTRSGFRFALGALVAVAIVAVGAQALVGSGVKQIGLEPKHPLVAVHDGRKIVFERRHPLPAPARHGRVAPVAAGARDLIVVHNVVRLKRPATVVHAAPAPARRSTATVVAAAPPTTTSHERSSNPPSTTATAAFAPSQRDERSVAALRTTQTAPPADQRAESIAVMPTTTIIRDVAPLGGENAIVPHPAPIAYAENAEGTTAFEVSVDEHGVPTKCTITKASGYLVLDEAVCRAAMHARYSPRTINGRAVASLYHDAFTFRLDDNQ